MVLGWNDGYRFVLVLVCEGEWFDVEVGVCLFILVIMGNCVLFMFWFFSLWWLFYDVFIFGFFVIKN